MFNVLFIFFSELMCICINCEWVDRCVTYHSVEKQHGVDHISNNPNFIGNNPKIHVNLTNEKSGEISIEWDVRSCGSFCEDSGKWARLRPGQPLPT